MPFWEGQKVDSKQIRINKHLFSFLPLFLPTLKQILNSYYCLSGFLTLAPDLYWTGCFQCNI